MEGEGPCLTDPVCPASKVGVLLLLNSLWGLQRSLRQRLAKALTFFSLCLSPAVNKLPSGAHPSLPGAQNNYVNCPLGFIQKDGVRAKHVQTRVAGQLREPDKMPLWQVHSHTWASHWPTPYLNWLQNNPQVTSHPL